MGTRTPHQQMNGKRTLTAWGNTIKGDTWVTTLMVTTQTGGVVNPKMRVQSETNTHHPTNTSSTAYPHQSKR